MPRSCLDVPVTETRSPIQTVNDYRTGFSAAQVGKVDTARTDEGYLAGATDFAEHGLVPGGNVRLRAIELGLIVVAARVFTEAEVAEQARQAELRRTFYERRATARLSN